MPITSPQIDDPPRGLSRGLATFLASAADVDRRATEMAIALLPLGSRIALAVAQVIDTFPDAEKREAQQGEPTDFCLTDKGMEIIRECASWAEEFGIAATAQPGKRDRPADL
jgi:hypothetical protein